MTDPIYLGFLYSERTLYKYDLTLSQTFLVFICLQYKSFENNVGEGENAPNEQFLLFPQCLLLVKRIFSAIIAKFKIVVCKPFKVPIVPS